MRSGTTEAAARIVLAPIGAWVLMNAERGGKFVSLFANASGSTVGGMLGQDQSIVVTESSLGLSARTVDVRGGNSG